MITFKRSFPWVMFRSVKPEPLPKQQPEPLREFVYLDEVSLASLLTSQIGELTENTTSQSGDETASELGGTISGKNPIGPSAEVNSRFQTSNSSSLQTVRKANAQSLFRELHKLDYVRKVKPVAVDSCAKSVEELYSGRFMGAVYREKDLQRGDLLELKVKLSASWIFHISTIVDEFSDMFEQNPEFFMGHSDSSDINSAKNANKIISKLLAGLIPVEGVVSDYVVLEEGGKKSIVHCDVIEGLDAKSLPLRIVGVTEHLAYWKDIRRVLFSDYEFTVLCRLSQTNIQNNWNPIKAADIFKEFAPDLSNQIEAATRSAMLQSAVGQVEGPISSSIEQLEPALNMYKNILLDKIDYNFKEEELTDLVKYISEFSIDQKTDEGRKAAFSSVASMIVKISGQEIDPLDDLAARNAVRKNLNLQFLSQPDQKMLHSQKKLSPVLDEVEKQFLDVEIVAIYW